MEAYLLTLISLTFLGLLQLTSILILDYSLIKRKHIPGTVIEESHRIFAFRANRALGNLNESFTGLLALAVVAIFINAPSLWVNLLTSIYVISRIIYAVAYWTDTRRLRSYAFCVSLAAITLLFFVDSYALYVIANS